MIITLLYIFISMVLIGIAYQDVKLRAIHFILPLLLFVAAIGIWSFTSAVVFRELVFSAGFLFLCLFAIVIQFSLKEKALSNPFNKVFGVGDIAYLLAVIPLFSFRNYLVYIVTGMIFSLLLHVIIQQFQQQNTIPLAGYLSVYLVLVLGILAINQHVQQLYINIF